MDNSIKSSGPAPFVCLYKQQSNTQIGKAEGTRSTQTMASHTTFSWIALQEQQLSHQTSTFSSPLGQQNLKVSEGTKASLGEDLTSGDFLVGDGV